MADEKKTKKEDDSLLTKIKNGGKSAYESVASTVGDVTDYLSNTGGEFIDNIADKASGAVDWASNKLDKVGESVGGFADDALSTVTDMANKASEIANDVTEWSSGLLGVFDTYKNKAIEKIKSAFVASDNKQGVENAELTKLQALGVSFTNFKNKTFKKFKELADGFTSAKDAVLSAKNNIVKSVQSVTNAGLAIGKSITNTVTSVIQPVRSFFKKAVAFTDPNNIKKNIEKSLDFLPFNIGSIVGSRVANLSGKFHSKLKYVSDKLHGVENLNHKVEGLLKFTENSPELTNDLGKLLIGLANDEVSKADLMELYDAAVNYCNNVQPPDFIEYNNNKLVYETLVKQSIENGCNDLLNQLLHCEKYFSYDTTLNLEEEMDKVAKNGDIYTANTIIDAAGTKHISDNKRYALTMGVNLKYTNPNFVGEVTTEENGTQTISDINKYTLDQYNHLLTKLQIEPSELVKDETIQDELVKEMGVLNAQNIILLATNKNDGILNETGIDKEKTQEIVNIFNKYSEDDTATF